MTRRAPAGRSGLTRGGGRPGTGPGFPEFQPGGREGTTMARPAALQPGGHAAARAAGGRPSGRVLALGGGLLVAVVAVVAFFTLGPGHGQPARTRPGRRPPHPAASRTRSAPAPPRQASRRSPRTSAGGTQVRFSWTYANPAAGDTFRWQRVSGTAAHRGA